MEMNSEIESLMKLRFGGSVEGELGPTLFGPLSDITSRPRKKLRGQLVQFSFELAKQGAELSQSEKALCHQLQEVVELIHTGSLIIDDVQDNSLMRRGKPSVHREYGTALAINAGNWLYFWPCHLIQKTSLTHSQKKYFYEIYHQIMMRAHFGQAIDVGTRIDKIAREKRRALSLACMELKSGSLTSLATITGAMGGGADPQLLDRIENFGVGFGVALQMFDDLGNVIGEKDPSKRWEDLKLCRPSWIWANLESLLSQKAIEAFEQAVSALPEPSRLCDWFEQNPNFLNHCRQKAGDHLKAVLNSFSEDDPIESKFHQLGKALQNAYA